MNIDKTALLQRIDAMNAEMAGTAVTGWKLVPVEPTEEMIVDGFESAPDEFFSPPATWREYSEMSGCQKAAHRAELCYRAMLAAAPVPPVAQAPYGWLLKIESTSLFTMELGADNPWKERAGAIPLYAAPVLADLTDAQIVEVADSVGVRSCLREWYITFAHAILAKAAAAQESSDLTDAQKAAPELLAALKEARRAIGDHYAPNDCYSTGPMTGNELRDLVQCPACSAIAMFDDAIAKCGIQS